MAAWKKTYTTEQGDVWDKIAYKVYGDEKYAYFLMENNYQYLDILIFSAGTVLSTPELPEELDGDLPPWRTSESETDEDPYDL